jgi:hypothetical protein
LFILPFFDHSGDSIEARHSSERYPQTLITSYPSTSSQTCLNPTKHNVE